MALISKEGLLTLLSALEKINRQIPVTSEFDPEVYGWCQSQALDLGNYLEAAYPEMDTKGVIRALEDYCENIYYLSQVSTREDRRGLANECQRTLGEVRRFICEDMPGAEGGEQMPD